MCPSSRRLSTHNFNESGLSRVVLVGSSSAPCESDDGAIVLKAADRHRGLLAALTATVPDARAPARVTHEVSDLLRSISSRLASVAYPWLWAELRTSTLGAQLMDSVTRRVH